MCRMLWKVTALIVALTIEVSSAGIATEETENRPSAFELNGFRLLQYRVVPEKVFGSPMKEKQEGHIRFAAYSLNDSAYMVFQTSDKFPEHIMAIQLTGERADTVPFHGLVLGSTREEVITAFGEPDERSEVNDLPLEIWRWHDANYSLEFDSEGLYSIEIHVDESVAGAADLEFDTWSAFVDAVQQKSKRELIELMRPDAEFFLEEDVLAIDTPFGDYADSFPPELEHALFHESGPLQTALKVCDREMSLRVMDTWGIGSVHKFSEGCPVIEITFMPYGGRLKLWEVAFDFTVRESVEVEVETSETDRVRVLGHYPVWLWVDEEDLPEGFGPGGIEYEEAGIFEHPCGYVRETTVKALPPPGSPGFLKGAEKVLELNEQGEVVSRWAMPVDSWVMGVGGNSIIASYRKQAAPGEYEIAGLEISATGELRQRDAMEASARAIECPPALTEDFGDSSYLRCAEFEDLKSGEKRVLAYEGVCT